MSSTVILFLVLYYVVVLGIGYWALRRGAGDDLEGFLLGGRICGRARFLSRCGPACNTRRECHGSNQNAELRE